MLERRLGCVVDNDDPVFVGEDAHGSPVGGRELVAVVPRSHDGKGRHALTAFFPADFGFPIVTG